MSFFISNAWAAAPAAAQTPQGMIESLLPLAVIFVIFYFLLIRPQAKRAKDHKKMVEALSKGDEVVTSGGVLGKVTALGENFVEVEVAENTRVKVQRQMISTLMPKGTIKSL